ncbi:MAG TPA: flagellar biosynthesis anti-sigma factor FlgM [Phycisphaerales bacterium]|nr:flagellar biosynthesis anti-sigma factor FlgM [Phycisphaerales bacterium]
MNSITSTNSISSTPSLRLGEDSFSRRVEPKPLALSRAPDRVELSDAARQAASQAPVRLDLVSRVREQIAAGTYDSPERTDAAVLDMTRSLRSGG